MFSADLDDGALAAILGHVSVPALLVASLADEYVPSHIDAPRLMRRLAAAMSAAPHVAICELEGAPHAPDDDAHVQPMLAAVLALLARVA